jgi:hypothetical protein
MIVGEQDAHSSYFDPLTPLLNRAAAKPGALSLHPSEFEQER